MRGGRIGWRMGDGMAEGIIRKCAGIYARSTGVEGRIPRLVGETYPLEINNLQLKEYNKSPYVWLDAYATTYSPGLATSPVLMSTITCVSGTK